MIGKLTFLDWLFPKKLKAEKQMYNYFKTLSGYAPVYTSFDGGLYEMALTRACIHTFANHISKLRPVVTGARTNNFQQLLDFAPNPWQDTKKYLYRLATIYAAENNAFIIPMYDKGDDTRTITGLFPVVPSEAAIVENAGRQYVRFRFPTGTAAMELDKVGLLTQMQYKDDFFGEKNGRVLRPTLELLNAQNQSIINGVKDGGSVRFLAKLAQVLKSDAINDERDRLVKDNLSNNNGGVMIFDQKYEDIKPIESHPYMVDEKQGALIRESVFDYFGMSDAILQNKYTADEWSAYYEGKIEPAAIELSLVHTLILFDREEIRRGKQVAFTVNRLQHMTMADKLSTVTQLFDRGMMNMDEGREVFQMPPLGTEDSKRYYIRREYAEVNALNQKDNVQNNTQTQEGETNADQTGQGVQGNSSAQTDGDEQKN